VYGQLYSGITFVAQAEESIALVSVEAPSQPFSGCTDDKASSPCLKTWDTHAARL